MGWTSHSTPGRGSLRFFWNGTGTGSDHSSHFDGHPFIYRNSCSNRSAREGHDRSSVGGDEDGDGFAASNPVSEGRNQASRATRAGWSGPGSEAGFGPSRPGNSSFATLPAASPSFSSPAAGSATQTGRERTGIRLQFRQCRSLRSHSGHGRDHEDKLHDRSQG